MENLRTKFQNNEDIFRDLTYLCIRLYAEQEVCVICNRKTNLLKTSSKDCYSFRYGKFRLIEGFFFCHVHKYVVENSDQIFKYHSQLATEIVERGYRISIDLVVKVGLLRYRDNRQLQEIQSFLKCSSARIDLPISTIGLVSKRFLEYCRLLHKKYEFKIVQDISCNGGYVANFDGTTEKNSGVINFVVMDSLSEHILISEMIESENCEKVIQILRKIKLRYGNPLTTISDLKPGFLSACEDSFNKKVPHKFCDFHFLRTFKDIFNKDHNFLKKRLCSTWKITSNLRKQLKSIDKPVGKRKILKHLKDIENYWKDSNNVSQTYRRVLEWILRFKKASSGKGLPFDLPYLELYERLIRGKKFMDMIDTETDISIKRQCANLDTLIEQMDNSKDWSCQFKKSVKMLKFARKWFKKLRAVLLLGTLQDKQDPFAPLSKRYQLTEEQAKAIPKNIKGFLEEVEKAILSCKNPDKVKILTRLRDQTKKYQNNLKIPLIIVSVAGVLKTIIPSRTNNCLESFFRLIKALLRRNTGRSALTKEFASVGALLPYYISMRNHKTFNSIFESEDRLIEEFSAIIKDKGIVSDIVINFQELGDRYKNPSEIAVAMA